MSVASQNWEGKEESKAERITKSPFAASSKGSHSTELNCSMQEKVKAVKATAVVVKEYALNIRETARAIRETGAVPEIAMALREISSIISTVSKEVRELSNAAIEQKATNKTSSSTKGATQSPMGIVNAVKAARDPSSHARTLGANKTFQLPESQA